MEASKNGAFEKFSTENDKKGEDAGAGQGAIKKGGMGQLLHLRLVRDAN